MGCGVNVRVLPIVAQRAIKSKQDPGNLVLSLSHYDQNYEWYCATCQKLQFSAVKTLTLNFDVKADLPGLPFLWRLPFVFSLEET